ncbi:unnamed protein product [Trifolium pratense]|uniref:Uncharacterized protein n=1 Tax=Trifolium pratense TaxID=57577 RepID=A0ACB0I7H2_TRIPR|nr:unnamed protein product [Trifolium pratense]
MALASIHSLLLFLLGVMLLTSSLLAATTLQENPPNDYKYPKRLPAPQRPKIIVPYPREPPINDPLIYRNGAYYERIRSRLINYRTTLIFYRPLISAN